VQPWQVLALTFTNKAAREMKERIAKVVGGSKAHSVWAGTFHSIFARILRTEAEHIGFPKSFTIYDTEDAKSLIRSIVKELNLVKENYAEGSVLQRISAAKTNLIPPKAYAENEQLMAEDRATKRPHLHKVYDEYLKRCKRAGAMDFDDLLYQLFILLHKHEEIREKYQQKFKYLLVDEFQDTNHLQYAILRKLVNYEGSPHNICVVGDDAQSIYAFRGATIENILEFERDFKELKTFKLEQNYRSTHHIVQAANQIISYNRKQIKKEIWTDKVEGQRIKVLKTMTDQEEAKRVADLILEHKNRNHFDNREIAILYRTNAQSRAFEESLRRANIPYRVYGGMSFYQRKEVKDVIAYLRLVVNQQDDEALRRIINYPRRGIGDSTMEKISAQAAATAQTLWETLPLYEGTAREKNALLQFVTTIKAFIDRAKKGNAYDIAHFAVRQSGIMDTLKTDTTLEGLGRIENINALLNAISEFVDNDELIDDATLPDKSLGSYLQNIALVTDADKSDPNADVVTMMSVHSAKGLEYKSVFVVGLEEGLFPSNMSQDSPDSLDEERRLFYVAVTRAESFLTLTYANSRYRFGQMKFSEPSRFLEEIASEHVETTGSGGSHLGARPMTQSNRSTVTGNYSRIVTRRNADPVSNIDTTNFKASPPEKMQVGMKVLHLKFGEGTIEALDGAKDNPVATITFANVTDQPTKKIMLKFAKLQIVEA
jgi:DNA helicase II / ATP-dependent DNA helicase PcrA